MDRNRSYGFETPFYGYAQVEAALGAMLGADAATRRGALRARGKRLLTLGLPGGKKPGKGSRRLYSWSEVCQLAVAFLLEDCGLDPVVVVPAIKFFWPHVGFRVRQATSDAAQKNPMMLHIRVRIVTGPWAGKDSMPWIGISPLVDERSLAKYKEQGIEGGVAYHLAYLPKYLLEDRNDLPHWLAIRNLTAELVKLQSALHSS